MTQRQKLAALLWLISIASSVFAKGIKAPPKEKGGLEEEKPVAVEPSMVEPNDLSKDDKKVASVKQEETLPFSEALFLFTGFGKISAKKSGKDYKADGFGEVGVAYRVLNLPTLALDGIFRYAPFDVAPQIGKPTATEYKGVVETYNVGAIASMNYGKAQLGGGMELAFVNTRLYETIHGSETEKTNETGVGVNVPLVVRWRLLEKFYLGPKIVLGFGAYSFTTFGVNTSFAF